MQRGWFGQGGVMGLVIALGALGCAEQGQPPQEPVSVELAALENPLITCQQEGADCAAAATSNAEYQACSDAFRMCLQGAADTAQQTQMTILDCQGQARDCVVQGGPSAIQMCRADYEACVGGTAPGGGAAGMGAAGAGAAGTGGIGGLPLPGSGGTGGLGGLPLPGSGGTGGLGGLPLPGSGGAGGLGLPGLPPLPGSGGAGGTGGGAAGTGGANPMGASACIQGLRDCVINGGDPLTCGNDARACLRSALLGTP